MCLIDGDIGGEVTKKSVINLLAMLANAFFFVFNVTNESTIYIQNQYQRPTSKLPNRPQLENIHSYLFFWTHIRFCFFQEDLLDSLPYPIG